MGEPGVRHVMKALLADFDILMNVGGFQNIGQIDRNILGMSLGLSKVSLVATNTFQLTFLQSHIQRLTR